MCGIHGNDFITFKFPQGEVGDPVEIVTLGTTDKTVEELKSWLKDNIASGLYSASAYKLLDNNCVCFTNALSEFLCGKPINEKYFATQKRAKLLGIQDHGRDKAPRSNKKSVRQKFTSFFKGDNRESVEYATEVKLDGTLNSSNSKPLN